MSNLVYNKILEDILNNTDSGIIRRKAIPQKVILYGSDLDLNLYLGCTLRKKLNCEIEIMPKKPDSENYAINTDWLLKKYTNPKSP